MTKGQKEFMAMLADTADVDGWRLRRDGRLRSESGCCPIMAVAGASLDDPPYIGNDAWTLHTEDCGLSLEEGKEISQAADGEYRSAVKGGYLPRLQELREGLLDACGLWEEE